MTESEANPSEIKSDQAPPVISNILQPTLHDNDFLQSFVRIGLDEAPETKRTSFADERRRYISSVS